MTFGLGLGFGLGTRTVAGGGVNLDFTTGSLPAGMTFTRASSGTYFDSGGVLQTASTDVARFPYQRVGGVWVRAGIRIEPAATNLLLQSNGLSTTANWVQFGTPVPTANVTGPGGVSNSAWTLTDNSAASVEFIRQTITLTAATHVFSVFVKKTTGAQASYPVIGAGNVAATHAAFATIDTSNGTATLWTGYTGITIVTSSANITDCGDFWRVELTFLATATDWQHNLYTAGTTNATQSTGTIANAPTGSAVFYGAQCELGSRASSYIATTTGTVTRAADVASYTIPAGVSTLRYTFDNDTAQDAATSPGAWTIPTNLNRSTIKFIDSV